MIINLKHKKDLITVDLRTKQIRYLEEIEKIGKIGSTEIHFIKLYASDVEAYEYLFKNEFDVFKSSIKEDIKSFLNKEIDINKLEVIKNDG